MQRGGIQGEHNATKLVFAVSDELAEVLYEKSNRDKLVYRFEAHTGTGEKNSTVPEEIQISDGALKEFDLEYKLENWLTRNGGNISVYLIFSVLVSDETLIDLYSYPARLKLEGVPDADYTDGQNYESVAKLSVAATDAAARAEAAAEVSKEAEANTKAAEKVLTEGTFIFLGGDAEGSAKVELVTDSELSETSTNPIQNATAAKEFNRISEKHNLDYEALDKAIKENKKEAENNATDIEGLQDSISEYADYPIEIGKNGIWNYTKYKSGRCKMWGITEAVANITSAFGSVFRSTEAYSEEFPFEFEEPPVCLCDLSAKGNWAVSKFSNETATVNKTCTVYASRPEGVEGNAVPIVIHWKVIGNLKTEE